MEHGAWSIEHRAESERGREGQRDRGEVGKRGRGKERKGEGKKKMITINIYFE
jgi:hypothetical protein